ncbi:MAG: GNAT family N-acetyltransferase [Hyphomonadaceae bacterium]
MPAAAPAQAPSVFPPSLIAETPAHALGIERVLDAAFGPGRFAKPSERVREFARRNQNLCRVALVEGRVIGVCRIYDIRIGDAPAYFLGPLAVDPAAQHGGLGHALARASIEACRAIDARPILLMGQPSFFTILGFTPAHGVAMPMPVEARRLLWLPGEGAAAGLVGPA